MGNCLRFCQKRNISPSKRKKKIVLLLVGLDNAGKTTAAKSLIGEPTDATIPTVGFSSVSLTHRGYSVVLYDLGGGAQIRDIWHRYFMDVHGVIFVVDASDASRLDEGRKVLETILAHDHLAGKPVLLLANKQDREGALDELDIVERLNVETVVNQHRCPTMVETCSALQKGRRRRRVDRGIHNGYRWLLNLVVRDYGALNERVERDQAGQRQLLEAERHARQERARLSRAARGEANGTAVLDEETAAITGDPFRPIAEVVRGGSGDAPCLAAGVPSARRTPPAQETASVPGTVDSGSASPGSPPVNYVEIDNRDDRPRPSSAASITEAVREQLELDLAKPRRRQLLRRGNRTAPAPVGEAQALSPGPRAPLPPLQARRGPPSAKDPVWGLTKSLEVVPSQPAAADKTSNGAASGTDA
ncbi:ADP-ribosylation factor-like protein 13B [Bacillus rossius redtenbacheri]|uniref:ADP-ribosylation factor-like protein 13B n=1 Tax=Bacillus rossius redtenbacheri TaxID=93214 RepID=UPI002FDECC17